jgi:hypothetical protein
VALRSGVSAVCSGAAAGASSSGMTRVVLRSGAASVSTGASVRGTAASATSAESLDDESAAGHWLKGIAPLAAYPPATTDAARQLPAATDARSERRGDIRMLLLSAPWPGS